MIAVYVLTGVISAFGGVMSLLLMMILQRLSRLEDKLDGKQDKGDCSCYQDRLREALQDIWDAFDKHSHEGLAPGSKVTR
jgi:hypothetical protein